MSKLFLVEFGLYEDTWAAGVFTTMELAETFVADTGHSIHADWEKHASIREIELDRTAEDWMNPKPVGFGWSDQDSEIGQFLSIELDAAASK